LGPPVSSRGIIGRDRAREAVEGILDLAADGHPRLGLVAGEAGIGKTRLVGDLEALARERGFHVLHGESVEFGGDELPYAPVVAALRDLPIGWAAEALDALPVEAREELAALLPRALPAPSGTPARFSGRFGQGRLYELLLDLLGRLARDEAPVLVVLEDVHWADRSSHDLLAFLARNLRDERVAVVATYRTDELDARHPLRRLLPELARRPAVVRVELAPLTAAEVARQLEAIAGGPVPDSLAARLQARAGGNPFLVEELFAAGGGDGDLVPDTLAEAVVVRVARLELPAQQLLDLVAAAGGRIDHDVLDRVAGDLELPAALRAALDAHILVRERDDRGVVFRHGLLGEVVYERLLPQERRRMHRAIAAALAETPDASAAQLAHQWHRAGEHAGALRASVAAGMDASRLYAFAEARGHFERALELWEEVAPAAGSLPVDRVELLARAAQAARFAGDAQRAIALCEEALDRLDYAAEPIRAALLYERLGEFHFWDDAMALGCYRQALGLLPGDAGRERARLLAAKGHALMGLRRWEESRASCEAALAVAAAEEDADEAEVGARTTLGLVLGFLGEPEAGEQELRRALETAETLGAGEDAVRAHLLLGELLRLRGDRAGALDVMVQGEAAAARLGMRDSLGNFMLVNGADDLLRLGRWDEADARMEEAGRRDLGSTSAVMHHTIAGHLHALRGNAEAAHLHLARALELAADGLPNEFVTPLRGAWAAHCLAQGDASAARGHVEAALAAVGDAADPLYTPALHALGVRAEAELAERARALRRDGDLAAAGERARGLVADLEAMLEQGPGGAAAPDALANLALARAELSRVDGVPAPERWQAAAERWESLAEPHPAAYANFRQAEALLPAGGDRVVAGRRLRAAHAAAVGLGAGPLREQAETLARRARLPLEAPPATGRPAPDTAPAAPLGLTAREAEVLCLLADGLTNREIAGRLFISQKTVGAHLTHIFDKLDVHSRVEAAGRAHQLGMVGGGPG
jgi:DNA-binding CsgD family transcriptional regulator/tetratricopeptide (TPR) repeat protein